ncbi:hypothetical protein NOR_08115 [Metarhizium rileyi]|uniref:Uncharacterized protein n=1 Tax=Metarhizium rileyi (strain RCEF 4871) TaxID=1649241 RepID=A0A166WXB7_METRR|nr:hypothetical protein NOR_08115 [Metarhizium rileyi RCEF 4871]
MGVVSRDSIRILERDMVSESDLVNGMIKASHPIVSSGPEFDALNAKAFQVFDEALQGFNAHSDHHLHVKYHSAIMFSS